jgi:hypothetical protein
MMGIFMTNALNLHPRTLTARNLLTSLALLLASLLGLACGCSRKEPEVTTSTSGPAKASPAKTAAEKERDKRPDQRPVTPATEPPVGKPPVQGADPGAEPGDNAPAAARHRHEMHRAPAQRPAPMPAPAPVPPQSAPPAPQSAQQPVTPKSTGTKVVEGEQGVMNFDPPKTMTLNSAVTVDVAIRRKGSTPLQTIPSDADASGKYGLSGDGPVQGVSVAVADVMDVELRAEQPGAFTITPNDDQRKSVDAGGHAEWHWSVTPLKEGPQKLLLHSMRIRTLANGRELPPTDDDTTVAQINVTVLPWSQRIIPATAKLLGDNWKSILAFLLPGGGGAILLAWWQKHKKKGATSEEKP